MLLGGLWHGAGWNFVVWGGLHGLFLTFERLSRRARPDPDVPIRARDLPRLVLTFHAVCFCWVAFRAPTLATAVTVWRTILLGSYHDGLPVVPTLVVAASAGLHLAERKLHARLPRMRALVATASWGPLVEGAALGVLLATAVVCSGGGAEFIYFQF
jgi:alginate O-acetyltransferase complex protein AlgI